MGELRNTDAAPKLIAPTPELGERELHITILRDDYAQFEGSAAQLRAEGFIPHDFKWPHAAADKHWEANGFDYWLRRTRPADWKGPMKSWLELDNWFVRIEVTGRDYIARNRLRLDRKSAELQAEYRGCTPAGRHERHAKLARCVAARLDRDFQAFKELITGPPPKRGRKTKTTVSGAGQ